MKNIEEIEAIALEKYPRIENPKNNHLKLVDSVRAKERQAFIEAYEQAQNDSQQSHDELLEALKLVMTIQEVFGFDSSKRGVVRLEKEDMKTIKQAIKKATK